MEIVQDIHRYNVVAGDGLEEVMVVITVIMLMECMETDTVPES